MNSGRLKDGGSMESEVPLPPRGWAMLMLIGPGLMWCGEYIGSGEVVLTTRAGAILGVMVLWVPTLAIFAKFWIGLVGAHYTVCTGEGMIDMMARTPGPRNWVLWPVVIVQLCTAMMATGVIASLAGFFAHHFMPLPGKLLGWLISLFIIGLVWSGRFGVLKKVMAILVFMMILGIFEVVRVTWPGWGTTLAGLFYFQVPEIPAWVVEQDPAISTPWGELLPLLGWAAGGFASQVWYTYWVLGAGYGMAHNRSWGQPLDPDRLRRLTIESAKRLKGWCRMVAVDATVALVIGIVITAAFLMAGAGVLAPERIAPKGEYVAIELSHIFGERWGKLGASLFMLAGLAAMVSTMTGQFAGWPRMLSDCFRLLVPGAARFSWKTQFRFALVCFAISNLVIVHSFGYKPVVLAKVAAIVGGLILTPLQVLSVGLTFYFVMPRMFSSEVYRIIRPNPVYKLGLLLAFILFGYFCIVRIPTELHFLATK